MPHGNFDLGRLSAPMPARGWTGRRVVHFRIPALTLALALAGCASMGTFESPQVLPKNATWEETGAGVGVLDQHRAIDTNAWFPPFPLLLTLGDRQGKGGDWDRGIAFTYNEVGGLNLQYGIKYQALRDPFLLSFSLAGAAGFSFFDLREAARRAGVFQKHDRAPLVGPLVEVKPTLFLGEEWLFLGLHYDVVDSRPTGLVREPGVTLGSAFGESDYRLVPQLSCYLTSKHVTTVLFQVGYSFMRPPR